MEEPKGACYQGRIMFEYLSCSECEHQDDRNNKHWSSSSHRECRLCSVEYNKGNVHVCYCTFMEKQSKFHQLYIQSPYKPSLSGWKLYGNESSKKLESSYLGCKFPCWFASACTSILLGVRIAAKWFFIPKVLRSTLWWGELGSAARPTEYQCCIGSLSTAQNFIRNHIRPWSCSCRQREKNIGPGRCVQLKVKQVVCCSCFT